MTEEFTTDLDAGMLRFFRDIADVMVRRIGISRAEAVARINRAFGGVEIGPYPDLMCHELPEYWAYGLYYAGDVPYWEPETDTAGWEVRPAPAAGGPEWTLPEG